MKTQFYVNDGEVKYFDSVPQVVKYLEVLVERKFGQTRKQWMDNLISLGYQPDDLNGKTFTESVAERVEIGLIKNSRRIRCNIHEAINFRSPEYGV